MKKILQLTLLISLPINASSVREEDIVGRTKFIKVTPVIKDGIEGRKVELCSNEHRIKTVCKNIGPKSFYSIEELEEVEQKIKDGSNSQSLKSTVITTSTLGVIGAAIGYATVVGTGGLILVPIGFAAGVGVVIGITASNGIDNVIRKYREDYLIDGVLDDRNVKADQDQYIEEFAALMAKELKTIP